MQATFVPFRLDQQRLQHQVLQFNARSEVQWFGFAGACEAPATILIALGGGVGAGALGGGGTNAINGGVIAAGFDAAFVLAGLAQYEADVVVTLELSVKFLALAVATRQPTFAAGVVRSSRRFAFVQGVLGPRDNLWGSPYAVASGMVAPAASA